LTSVYASIAPACELTLLPTIFSQHSLSVETNVSSNLITTRPITLGCSDQEKVTGSHFDIGCIVAAVRFVTEGAISMRASSRVCGIIFQLAGCKPFEYPSHTTVQNFLLRICLYLLQQNSQRHDDWVWIADHTYSVGTVKVFAILGIRRSHFVSLQRPVQHQDLVVLAMLSVESSNGLVVEQQFEDLAAKVGNPLAILSDAGSDLHKGTKLFQDKHANVIPLYDIVHMTSRKIEKIMNADERWDKFRKDCCTCANAVRQSKLAHLKPPRPRAKARYMNIDHEVRWGARALQVLDRVRLGQLNPRQKERLQLEQVEAKLSWLDNYRDSIKRWECLSLTGRQVISEVRRQGYGTTTVAAVERIAQATTDPACLAFVEDIAATVKPMCEDASQHGRLPSSSEVLESLFGKGKRLLSGSNTGTTNSLTRQLLAMVACTVAITPTLVRAALANCSIADILKWSKANFGQGLHYNRRLDLTPTPEEQNLRKHIPTAIPVF
jgi:hypothetical protein